MDNGNFCLDMGKVYIQRGVKKIYNDGSLDIEYVSEFTFTICDRNGYCIDSRGVNFFFYKFDNDEYRLMECNRNISYVRYIVLDELESGYISLFDFINEGIFVGREFVRKTPVITYLDNCEIKDNAYLCSDSKYIVMYMMDNIFLAKHICGNSEEYCIIDCRYITDGMYSFVGDVYDGYRDRDKVYLDIIKQVDDYCKKKIRKYDFHK